MRVWRNEWFNKSITLGMARWERGLESHVRIFSMFSAWPLTFPTCPPHTRLWFPMHQLFWIVHLADPLIWRSVTSVNKTQCSNHASHVLTKNLMDNSIACQFHDCFFLNLQFCKKQFHTCSNCFCIQCSWNWLGGVMNLNVEDHEIGG